MSARSHERLSLTFGQVTTGEHVVVWSDAVSGEAAGVGTLADGSVIAVTKPSGEEGEVRTFAPDGTAGFALDFPQGVPEAFFADGDDTWALTLRLSDFSGGGQGQPDHELLVYEADSLAWSVEPEVSTVLVALDGERVYLPTRAYALSGEPVWEPNHDVFGDVPGYRARSGGGFWASGDGTLLITGGAYVDGPSKDICKGF